VNTDLQRAEEITQRYHVEGVPEIVINGKYTTDVGKAGSHEQLSRRNQRPGRQRARH